MKNTFRTSTALFALALFALCPARSEAGLNYGAFPVSCYKNADSSGSCWVSLAGFRANADPNAWVYIAGGVSTTGLILGSYGSFNAYLNGTSYSCFVSLANTSPLREAWYHLATHTGPFNIQWDAAGHCTDITLYSMSHYQ